MLLMIFNFSSIFMGISLNFDHSTFGFLIKFMILLLYCERGDWLKYGGKFAIVREKCKRLVETGGDEAFLPKFVIKNGSEIFSQKFL